MRIPRQPPAFLDLLESIDSKGVIRLVDPTLLDHSRYLHWDDIRFRKHPDGLTAKEWWAATKLFRQGRAKKIPLENKEGASFTYFETDLMISALHQIDLGAGGAIGIPEPVTNPETKDYYFVRSLMEEAITSSQLEGAAVTRDVAKEMIKRGREPKGLGEQMIMNNYLTMQQLSEWKDVPLSPDLVFEIHRMITKSTLKKENAAGRFRNEFEAVEVVDDRDDEILHTPPHANQLSNRMDEMCRFANANSNDQPFVHPVIRAIILHYWLAYDHPFIDGNGRTARALFYWSMLRSGFWLFEYISISEILVKAPIQYARSYLLTQTDDNDLNYFIHYQLRVIESAIASLHSFIERKSKELNEAKTVMRAFDSYLNHRQESLISKALREPFARFTIVEHKNSHRVAYATARNDLAELEKLDLLYSVKKGKTYYYFPNKDLNDRLIAIDR